MRVYILLFVHLSLTVIFLSVIRCEDPPKECKKPKEADKLSSLSHEAQTCKTQLELKPKPDRPKAWAESADVKH